MDATARLPRGAVALSAPVSRSDGGSSGVGSAWTRKFQERATRKLSNLDLWATQQRATDAGRGRRRERGVRVRSSGSRGRTGRCGDPGASRGERLAAARRRRRVRTEGGARGRWHSPAWHPTHAHGPQIAGVRPGGVALVELAVGAVAGGRHRPGVRAPVAVHRDSFDRRRRAGTAARWQQLPPDRKHLVSFHQSKFREVGSCSVARRRFLARALFATTAAFLRRRFPAASNHWQTRGFHVETPREDTDIASSSRGA